MTRGIDPGFIKTNPELAAALRPLSDQEYERLKASIAEHHIKQPIVVDEHDRVIDGHHRLRAALELRLSLIQVEEARGLDEEGKYNLAISLNADRRQMAPEEIEEIAAARQRRREKAAQMREDGKSYRAIAETLDISLATVQQDLAGVYPHTPEYIVGRDGKEYPAVRVEPDIEPDDMPALSGNGRHKPKTNRGGNEAVAQSIDNCQTPPYALDPLLPYLNLSMKIWEPACGEGLLVEALYDSGFSEEQVIASDIKTGNNFFDYEPPEWDCLVTNPPYSLKYEWLERCYGLRSPFALLLPVETLGAKQAQVLFREYGVQVIFMDRRINFKMPNKGWDGSSAQFPVAWFTFGLELESDMVFARLNPDDTFH